MFIHCNVSFNGCQKLCSTLVAPILTGKHRKNYAAITSSGCSQKIIQNQSLIEHWFLHCNVSVSFVVLLWENLYKVLKCEHIFVNRTIIGLYHYALFLLSYIHCERRCILLVKEDFDLIAVHIGGKLNLVWVNLLQSQIIFCTPNSARQCRLQVLTSVDWARFQPRYYKIYGWTISYWTSTFDMPPSDFFQVQVFNKSYCH